MATVVKGNQKTPFSIATTLRCRGGQHYSFLWIDPLIFALYLIIPSVKQGGIQYHFSASLVYIYIYIYLYLYIYIYIALIAVSQFVCHLDKLLCAYQKRYQLRAAIAPNITTLKMFQECVCVCACAYITIK